MGIEYLILKMRCLNDSFVGENNRPEIARILRELADGIEGGEMPERVNDQNGNGVCVVEYQAVGKTMETYTAEELLSVVTDHGNWPVSRGGE